MNRPRVPLGLESSRATLNRAACAEAAAALATARQQRNLTVRDVSARLLLSPAQVTALEHVQPEAFYGAEFYAAALKKYAAFLGVESTAVQRARVDPAEESGLSLKPFRRTEPRPSPDPILGSTRRKPLLVAVGVAMTGLAGWLLTSAVVPWSFGSADRRVPARQQPVSLSISTAKPPESPPVPLAAPAPRLESNPEPTLTPISTTAGPPAPVEQPSEVSAAIPDAGHVKVARATWIFVRYEDNSTVEQRLSAGEEFLLRRRPVYVAVGQSEGTEVVIETRPIDNGQFTENGQLRLGSSYLAALAAESSTRHP